MPSRRDVLKQAAAGGAIAWTAPSVLRLGSIAVAESPGPCTDTIVILKWDIGSNHWEPVLTASQGTCIGVPAGLCDAAAQWVAGVLADPQITYSPGSTTGATKVVVTLPEGMTFIDGKAKHGNKTGCRPVDAVVNQVIIFEQTPSEKNAISHIEIKITACVPDDVLALC